MPSAPKTGCGRKAKSGWIALGFNNDEGFWYSSEGVFKNKAKAIDDIKALYPVDFAYAVRVPLTIKR